MLRLSYLAMRNAIRNLVFTALGLPLTNNGL
jgi:hypothetical protein